MDVLVLESDPGAAVVAIAQLQAAGHRVERCHAPGARAFPCAALGRGRCPLDDGAIDVVLTVRGRSHPRPSPLEDGITCALRHRAPVVVAGRTSLNPFADHAAAVAGVDDVVETCERTASEPQAAHSAIATRTLRETLTRAGAPSDDAWADVYRSGTGLRAVLQLSGDVEKRQRDVAAVRIVGALRAFDRSCRHIEIGCEDQP